MLAEQQLLGMNVFPSDKILLVEAGQFRLDLKTFP